MRDIYLYGVVVAVTAILLMSVGAEWMVKLVSGSSEPVVLENGAKRCRICGSGKELMSFEDGYLCFPCIRN